MPPALQIPTPVGVAVQPSLHQPHHPPPRAGRRHGTRCAALMVACASCGHVLLARKIPGCITLIASPLLYPDNIATGSQVRAASICPARVTVNRRQLFKTPVKMLPKQLWYAEWAPSSQGSSRKLGVA